MPKYFFVFIAVFLSVSSFSQEERKTQLWNYNKVSVYLSPKTSLEVVEKIHYTTQTNSVDVKFGDLWLTRKCNNWFEYAGGFRMNYVRKNNSWLEERRTMLLTELSKDIKKFDFSLSGRFEYRWFKEANEHFRFRQKLNINFPPVSKWGLNFFTSEESFIKMNSEKTHLARVYAGINTINKGHFEMKIYYSLEKIKSFDYWNTTDIIGMNMNIRL
ncbi:DUF2490 domain-containing protein [Maribellus comscasis]|uniref:DUF2490 domain-containing protein n=1 Tax=Maribellus comscasis TaxID=2681766 RepID=A0A6I6JUX4_9BACT|nr:DUF2490 domain-containing protein [Maribellus comscasis]QGY46925.1 DUF2490 domain-containing protein [Maribellus comscasis]